jgi:predicted nucleic acid-binding Zn ribbon protein
MIQTLCHDARGSTGRALRHWLSLQQSVMADDPRSTVPDCSAELRRAFVHRHAIASEVAF